MNWKYIAVHVRCDFCNELYTVTFWFSGDIPCFSFKCKCQVTGIVIPPAIEKSVCGHCERRVDCIVTPPFIVDKFTVNDVVVESWPEKPVLLGLKDVYVDDMRINIRQRHQHE